MSRHTPGPWKAEGAHVLLSEHFRLSPQWGALIDREGADAEFRANARLIAAAPDLLEALDDLYWLATENERLGAHKETYDKAQTAIAKATGQDNG